MDRVEYQVESVKGLGLEKHHWPSLHLLYFILHVIVFILYSSFISAQTPTREQLTGTWIGVHTELDLDFVCPLPTYIRLDTDSTYHLGMVDGSASEQVATWAVQGESVRLDTIHFAPRLITVQNELLRIGTNYPMVFRRFIDMPIDSAQVYQQVSGRVWQSDSLIVYLYANGKVALENPINNQRTTHFWRLVRFGKSIFLVIQGNQYTRDGGYKPLWQLSSLSPKQMQAVGWNGRVVTVETFRFVRNLTPGDTCRPSGFQACDNCFRQMLYESSLTRGQKRYDIVQLFDKKYRTVRQPGESGLIRIQFVINCEGEKGPFKVVGLGEDYCPKTFDSRIVSQLRSICSDYVATDPSIREPYQTGDRLRDVSISLAFRLKDGQLTDILP